MKLVNPIGRVISTAEEANYEVQPRDGCVCSSGQFWSSIFAFGGCNCQCDGDSANNSANYTWAYRA